MFAKALIKSYTTIFIVETAYEHSCILPYLISLPTSFVTSEKSETQKLSNQVGGWAHQNY
jgi:hypothetical protein